MSSNSYIANKKFVLIGIDGATFDVMDPLLKSGKLPYLASILNHGCRAKLKSLLIPTSPMSWTSIVTGKNPGKHGIFHFTEKVPGSYGIRFVNARFRQALAIWQILSHYGKRVIVVNVPITYPPDEVLGYMVSGFDAPDEKSNYTYPPELAQKISKWVGSYIIDLRLRSSVTKGKRGRILHDAKVMEEKKATIVCKLMQMDDWDFLMVVFNITDRIQHWFWQYMDDKHPNYNYSEAKLFGNAIFQSYQIVDRLIGKILKLVPKDTYIMIISDHGFGPATNKAFYLNHWLAQQGFLRYLPYAKLFRKTYKKFFYNIFMQIMKRLPRQWKGYLKRHFPSLKSGLVSYINLSDIDWSRTIAFSTEVDNFIYVNLKGREPQGIVDPDDYEECRNKICEALYSVKDLDGESKIIDKVYKREELYNGPFVSKAPDLIFTFKDNLCRVRPSQEILGTNGNSLRIHKAENWASGSHRLEGIFIFCGPGIQVSNVELSKQSILNIAPTILYTMGVPVPDDMDGKVIWEVFDSDFRKKTKIHYQRVHGVDIKELKPYEKEETEKIQERLKDLGYLD